MHQHNNQINSLLPSREGTIGMAFVCLSIRNTLILQDIIIDL